jgi:hypothetical protein
MVREAAEGPMVAPTPELSDDTPIERVLFSIRIQNALARSAGDQRARWQDFGFAASKADIQLFARACGFRFLRTT